MELIRCNCPRLGKVHKWALDIDTGIWYHSTCARVEGPPIFFRDFLTDNDFKCNRPTVETYKDECIVCEAPIQQDVKFESDITMCPRCEELNSELID